MAIKLEEVLQPEIAINFLEFSPLSVQSESIKRDSKSMQMMHKYMNQANVSCTRLLCKYLPLPYPTEQSFFSPFAVCSDKPKETQSFMHLRMDFVCEIIIHTESDWGEAKMFEILCFNIMLESGHKFPFAGAQTHTNRGESMWNEVSGAIFAFNNFISGEFPSKKCKHCLLHNKQPRQEPLECFWLGGEILIDTFRLSPFFASLKCLL
jgi:hypothetical protein